MNTEFSLSKVVELLARDGVKAELMQTGGGNATLYLGDPDKDGFYPVLCGPGLYNWDNPALSVGDIREFFIGKDGESGDEDVFAYQGANDVRKIANVIFNYFMDGLKNTDTCSHCFRFPATKGDVCECCTYQEESN